MKKHRTKARRISALSCANYFGGGKLGMVTVTDSLSPFMVLSQQVNPNTGDNGNILCWITLLFDIQQLGNLVFSAF